jgi:hypothetical protein
MANIRCQTQAVTPVPIQQPHFLSHEQQERYTRKTQANDHHGLALLLVELAGELAQLS